MSNALLKELYDVLLEDFDDSLNRSGVSGTRFASRLSALAKIGLTEENGSYRIGYSLEEKEAKELVAAWMKEAGLQVRIDYAGNVFGRLAGKQDQLPSILSGSHVDSVPNGGHFDGPLGVLAALEVVEAWKETGYQPEIPYEVVIFSDEEGARFNGGLTGSRAVVGDIDMEKQRKLLDLNGDDFTTVIENYGLSAESFPAAFREPSTIKAYIEVHIEQGKVLEKANVPVGIVTGIAGPLWLKMSFIGEAGHAGNTPMIGRKDALVAAGEFIAALPLLPAMISDSAVATIGKVEVHPNGVNVIPGQVDLYLDIRDIYTDTVDQLVALVIEKAKEITEKYKVSFDYKQTLKVNPFLVKEELLETLTEAVEKEGISPVYLPSGAGHDAMILGKYVPSAMIFARSKNGISHNPLEWTTLSDCLHAVHVLKHTIETLNETK